jgi:SAM-dependent MidA family methyltransferase
MSELTEIISREVATQGVISFARFMELALYCPGLGYYERQSKQIGCQGDFYTSVAVGSLFGELLAFQFVRWLKELPSHETVQAPNRWKTNKVGSSQPEKAPSRSFQIVEGGAHDGQLANDILMWIKRFEPAWLTRLEYWILEPSSERQQWQQEKLAKFAPYVRWFCSWESLDGRELQGVIFSNELLDSFPVHRIGWDAKARCWFEWGVGGTADHFIWKRMPLEASRSDRPQNPVADSGNTPLPSRGHPLPIGWGEGQGEGPPVHLRAPLENGVHLDSPQLPNELLAVLPDGFTAEISPAARRWWERAARALDQGKLMTLDYGLSSDDFFVPERANGTLRAYLGHHCSGDLLAHPGEPDLTAHVNFTALQRTGEAAGLVTENVVKQAQFLTRILERTTPQDTSFNFASMERRRQFQTLTHPEHLGRPFKVLVQSRP